MSPCQRSHQTIQAGVKWHALMTGPLCPLKLPCREGSSPVRCSSTRMPVYLPPSLQACRSPIYASASPAPLTTHLKEIIHEPFWCTVITPSVLWISICCKGLQTDFLMELMPSQYLTEKSVWSGQMSHCCVSLNNLMSFYLKRNNRNQYLVLPSIHRKVNGFW